MTKCWTRKKVEIFVFFKRQLNSYYQITYDISNTIEIQKYYKIKQILKTNVNNNV